MLINALSVIIGLLGTIALSGTMSFDMEKTAYTNSTVSAVFVIFAVIILRYVYLHIRWEDKRGIVCAGIYSVGLSFTLTVGKQLHTVENFDIGNIKVWIQMLMTAVFLFGMILYLLQWIEKKAVAEIETEDGRKDWKAFLFTWLILFVCWIPVFLAFYPGAFVYDAQDEYVQVATREFTTHHPLAHVLALGGFVCLGNKLFASYNIGIAMYTIFQMLVLSAVFAYTVSFLKKYLSKKICMGVTLFYGLFPVIPMYAVCSAKDTLFTGAFLVMLIQMFKLTKGFWIKEEACRNKCKKADVVLFVLASAAMMLLRNNGVMAFVVLGGLLVIFVLCKFKQRKVLLRFVLVLLVSLVLYGGVNKSLAWILHADDSENQEILTVPIQQLARTYKYSPEVFSKEDKEILISYIPEDILAIYDADLSDLVKVHFNNQKFSKEPSEFLGLWARTFVKKPVTYINAWLMTSYGYWYPDTVINVYGGQQRFTFQYEDSSYFGFETEQPGERDSKFPWLEEQYRKMSLEIFQQNVPGISMMFSPGFLFWIFIFCFLSCFYRKQYQWTLPFAAIFLLWGTVILGPTFLVRYVLILWFALPLMLLAFCKKM